MHYLLRALSSRLRREHKEGAAQPMHTVEKVRLLIDLSATSVATLIGAEIKNCCSSIAVAADAARHVWCGYCYCCRLIPPPKHPGHSAPEWDHVFYWRPAIWSSSMPSYVLEAAQALACRRSEVKVLPQATVATSVA